MKDMKDTSYEVCEWCDSSETIWDDEPDENIQDHPPRINHLDLMDVKLRRYCCSCCKSYYVVLRFKLWEGRRMNKIGE